MNTVVSNKLMGIETAQTIEAFKAKYDGNYHQLFNELGWVKGSNGNYHCFNSAAHQNGDANASLHLDNETSKWMCHGCGLNGNWESYWKDYIKPCNGLSYGEFLKQHLHITVSNGGSAVTSSDDRRLCEQAARLQQEKQVKKEPLPIAQLDSWVENLLKNTSGKAYLYETRRISEEIIKEYRLGLDGLGRFIFPIFNKNNELLNYKAYDPRGITYSKWIYPEIGRGNGVMPVKHLERKGRLFIMAGEPDCYALISSLGLNGVTFGSENKNDVVKELGEEACKQYLADREVVICLDADDAGVAAAGKLAASVYPYSHKIKVIDLNSNSDINPHGLDAELMKDVNGKAKRAEKDFTEFMVKQNWDRAAFDELVEKTPVWMPAGEAGNVAILEDIAKPVATQRPKYPVFDDNNQYLFWNFDSDGKLQLSPDSIIEGFIQIGCAKIYPVDTAKVSTLIHNDRQEVIEVSAEKIHDIVNDYWKTLPAELKIKVWRKKDDESGEWIDASVPKQAVRAKIINESEKLFKRPVLENLPATELPLIKDTADQVHLFYQNGYVEITAGNVLFKRYSESEDCIWRSWKIPREIKFPLAPASKGDYAHFTFNVCNKKKARYRALKSAAGYALSKYRDPSCAKAIVLCDEALTGIANGRTGKTLWAKALARMCCTSVIDGKSFDASRPFALQSVKVESVIVLFNDVKENFDFESQFHTITEGMVVEKKNKEAFHFPWDKTPRIIITTNYSISGEGGSAEDRRAIYEFYPHYSLSHKPVDEFGRNFFEGWNNDEWQRFDAFMIDCIQTYLRHGLLTTELKNYNKKKLIQQTSKNFVEWADDYFSESRKVMNVPVEKKLLAADFCNFCEVDSDKMDAYFVRTFIAWLKHYADYRKWRYEESVPRNYASVQRRVFELDSAFCFN